MSLANIQAKKIPRVRHDARVRARQNLKMLKITFCLNESTFQVILSIFKFSARTRPRARYARTQRARKGKIQNFYIFWIPYTILDNFH